MEDKHDIGVFWFGGFGVLGVDMGGYTRGMLKCGMEGKNA